MKFDVVIIGGGLSGLTCGIKLAENGKKVCIVSYGQSSLHFNPGSFELLPTATLCEILLKPFRRWRLATLMPRWPMWQQLPPRLNAC